MAVRAEDVDAVLFVVHFQTYVGVALRHYHKLFRPGTLALERDLSVWLYHLVGIADVGHVVATEQHGGVDLHYACLKLAHDERVEVVGIVNQVAVEWQQVGAVDGRQTALA